MFELDMSACICRLSVCCLKLRAMVEVVGKVVVGKVVVGGGGGRDVHWQAVGGGRGE